jgi:hypothetical protein
MTEFDPGSSTVRRKTVELPLLSLATWSFVVVWLAVACYAIAYLVSH